MAEENNRVKEKGRVPPGPISPCKETSRCGQSQWPAAVSVSARHSAPVMLFTIKQETTRFHDKLWTRSTHSLHTIIIISLAISPHPIPTIPHP